ncbi:MAG: hypothetical protein ACYTEQ_05250 [Planctomycetota bacterium]
MARRVVAWLAELGRFGLSWLGVSWPVGSGWRDLRRRVRAVGNDVDVFVEQVRFGVDRRLEMGRPGGVSRRGRPAAARVVDSATHRSIRLDTKRQSDLAGVVLARTGESNGNGVPRLVSA